MTRPGAPPERTTRPGSRTGAGSVETTVTQLDTSIVPRATDRNAETGPDFSDVLQAAQWLTRRGMHVHPLDHPSLPLCVGAKTAEHDPAACVERGKHPCTRWSTWATTDYASVAAELAGRSRNLGVACGPSGLLVVDEDRAGEFARYAAGVGVAVPATLTVRTGRGLHYYLRQPAGRVLGNAEGALGSYGVNVRGAGGYVVAPGSVHACGVLYEPVDPLAGIAAAPDWLVAALTTRSARGASGSTDRHPHRGPIPARHRHNALVSYAGRLRRLSVDWGEAMVLFRRRWQDCEQPPGDPCTWEEAEATLRDVWDRYAPGDPGADAEAADEAEIAAEARRLRIREAAAQQVRRESSPVEREPEILTLADLLAAPDEPVRYRVDRLWPAGGRFMLAAQAKAGKTTLRDNLVRALVDGGSFLGKYDVDPVDRRVVVLDTEMSRRMLRSWLRDQDVERAEQVVIVPLRGQAAHLDLLDPDRLAYWAAELRQLDAGVVLLDPLAPALSAAGLDEDRPTEVGRFLTAFDALLAAGGAEEGGVIHHMGHTGERSRGASRLRDWPDVEWLLVREQPEDRGEPPDPAAPRYFRAYGRDVDEPEQLLTFDPRTRHLSVAGGSRRDTTRNRHVAEVVDVVKAQPGMTANQVVDALKARGVREKRAVAARLRAEEIGAVRIERGPNRSKLHYLGGAAVLQAVAAPPVVGGAAPIGAPPPPPTAVVQKEFPEATA